MRSKKYQIDSNTKESRCQLCNEDETQHHYLACTSKLWTVQQTQCWKILDSKFSRVYTSPYIIAILRQVVADITTTPEVQEGTQERDSSYQRLNRSITEQTAIGWKYIFLG